MAWQLQKLKGKFLQIEMLPYRDISVKERNKHNFCGHSSMASQGHMNVTKLKEQYCFLCGKRDWIYITQKNLGPESLPTTSLHPLP